jgi:MFS family permease
LTAGEAVAKGQRIRSGAVTDIPFDRSYRALLAVPSILRILLGMAIARIAQAMVSVALVLFTLAQYGSPELAGIVTFASIFPGILVSPIAGVLLDRHGRIRLIIIDWVIALSSLALIGALALAHALPGWLLVLIATVSSLTSIFSATGLRTLFPLIVPEHLWERVNAVDSNGYVVAMILGPPIAAGLVALVGGPMALVLIGLSFGAAAVAIVGVKDPETDVTATGHILHEAWAGVLYVWRNPTLRGLGFAISTLNVCGGMTTIVVPLLVLRQLGANEAAVGLVFALSGISGMVSALIFGRVDSRGREWMMLVVALLGQSLTVLLLLPPAVATPAGTANAIDPVSGFVLIGASLFLVGVLTGPGDIALFTVRQRRTDPAWMGRAFAISMGFNYIGVPVGAALAGLLAASSLVAAVVLGVVACLGAGLFAAVMVPRDETRVEAAA